MLELSKLTSNDIFAFCSHYSFNIFFANAEESERSLLRRIRVHSEAYSTDLPFEYERMFLQVATIQDLLQEHHYGLLSTGSSHELDWILWAELEIGPAARRSWSKIELVDVAKLCIQAYTRHVIAIWNNLQPEPKRVVWMWSKSESAPGIVGNAIIARPAEEA